MRFVPYKNSDVSVKNAYETHIHSELERVGKRWQSLSSASTVLNNTQYSFNSRFAEGVGTNPEELIAAAHAGCFAMKWPLKFSTPNSMIILAIPCLHAEVRHSGTQACDLKQKNY